MYNLCSCILCKREFKVQHFNNHFTRAHNSNRDSGKGTGKFLIKCSCTICKLVLPISNLSRHQLTHNEKETKICPKCNIQHTKQRKYCSRKCANSRIHSLETKYKISCSSKYKTLHEFLTSSCKICNAVISKGRTTCIPCRRNINIKTLSKLTPEFRSEIGRKGGKISASKVVKRSKDEIALFELCSNHFTNVEHNKPIFNSWDADIIIHDTKTAILWNGPWHYKQMPLNNHSLSQIQNRDKIKIQEIQNLGWNVLVFEDRHFTPQTAFNDILKRG